MRSSVRSRFREGRSWEAGEMGSGLPERKPHFLTQTLYAVALSLGSPYVSDGKEYMFFINVCGDTKVPLCNNNEAAVCQEKKTDSTQVKIAGRHQNQTLRWVMVECIVNWGAAALPPPFPTYPSPAWLPVHFGKLPFVPEQLQFPDFDKCTSVRTIGL